MKWSKEWNKTNKKMKDKKRIEKWIKKIMYVAASVKTYWVTLKGYFKNKISIFKFKLYQ